MRWFILPSNIRWALILAGLAVASTTTPASVSAETFTDYEHRPAQDFTLPAVLSGSQGGTLLDILPDGRLVMMTTRLSGFDTDGVELRIETAVGARDFRYVGDLPLPGGDPLWFNPGGFLTINNDVTNPRIAIGNSNYSLAVLEANQLNSLPTLLAPVAAPLTITWFENLGADLPVGESFVAAAAWRDATTLAVASGTGFGGESHLHLLDVTSSPGSPTIALVIDNAPAETGGITFDANGNAYFGVGFGANVGDIRRFDTSAWPTPQNFADGTLVTTLLSTGWIQFDAEGNLLVGGGDLFGSTGQLNYFAIENPLGLQRLFDPDTAHPANGYNLAYNPVTGEILVWDNFGTDPQQVFLFAAETVPEPATWAMMGIGLAVFGTAVATRRSRRNPS